MSGVKTADIVTQKTESVIVVVCRGIHKYYLYRMIGFAQTVKKVNMM